MRCYFDGSDVKAADGSRWLTLAGFAAGDVFWTAFDSDWNTMLRERYPIAPYIHMCDLLSGNDPFERVAGWTDEKVRSLVGDALNLLESLNKTAFRSFICSIDVDARDRLVAEGYCIPEAPEQCVRPCIELIFNWYTDRPDFDLIEQAYIFFDRGE